MDPSDTLVLGRAKRSTAGNRLRALLDKAHTLNSEEGFEEVENDQDFEDVVEQKDVFDDDFASTDDEAHGDNVDPTILEKRLRKEERTQNQKEKRRNYHDPLAYLKKGPKATKTAEAIPKPSAIVREDADASDEEERASKRRKVSFSQPIGDEGVAVISPSESENEGSPQTKGITRRRGLGRKTAQGEVRRSVLRASTRKDRDEVDERAQEEQARKAFHPLRGPRKPHPNVQLTQADLIALALEREEENQESLKDWLKKEEERRLKSKEGRKTVEGPRIRWISRIEGSKNVEITKQVAGLEDGGLATTRETAVQSQFEIDTQRAKESLGHSTLVQDSLLQKVEPPEGLEGVPEIIPSVELPVASSSTSGAPARPKGANSPAGTASRLKSSDISAKEDADVEQQPLPLIKNYLILEEISGGPKREMEVVLGDHADWTCMPVVSIRNRMQTRRKPICPLTGRPASYRDPLTYIPFATVDAYRTIDDILHGKYLWSSESNVYLGEDGTHRPIEELEVAEGVMDEVEGWAQAVGWDGPTVRKADESADPPSQAIEVLPEEPPSLESIGTDDAVVLAADPIKLKPKQPPTAGVKRKVSTQRGSTRLAT